MRTSYGVGRYQASEGDALCFPHGPRRYSRGCLVFGGRGSTAAGNLTFSSGQQLMQGLAELGIATMTADWGGPTHWGADLAVTRADTGRPYQATQQGTLGTSVVVLGISMGTVLALRYAMAHPTRVAAIALVLPVPDVQGMYDGNINGFQAEIGTAYGARPSNAQNPASNTASFAGIPIAMWYSTDDPVALPTPTTTFAAATGATLTSLGAVGHTLDNIPPHAVSGFLSTYAGRL